MRTHIGTIALALLGIVGCASAPPAEIASPPAPEYLTPYGRPTLPFSPAVRVGDLLFLSGQIGTDGEGRLVSGGIEAETRQTLENIRDVLARTGSSLDRVVKCTVMLADMREWPAMNAVYATYFPANKPARSALGANGLALGARVEIECIAVAGEPAGGAPSERAGSVERADDGLAGRWRATFTLDSIRTSGRAEWTRPAGGSVATGTLVLAEADPVRGQPRLRGEMTVDFAPLLGRQMSCYEPGPIEVRAERADGGWRLSFTPNAFDCGFGGTAERSGDALVGRWDEASFAGPVAAGRFRLEPER
jgi:reactive intermediate/imine deaminase